MTDYFFYMSCSLYLCPYEQNEPNFVNLIEKGNLGTSFVIREIRNIRFSENKNCVVIIAEKYFYMVKGYVSVTIIIDNAGENTRIQICASGGGEGIIGFEYGREEKFENEIIDENNLDDFQKE